MRHATLVLAIAAAVVLGATLYIAQPRLPPTPAYVGKASLDVATWTTYRDSGIGLMFRYPARWHLQRIGIEPSDLSPPCEGYGAVLTDLAADLRHPNLASTSCTGLWEMRSLPTNFVVVEVARPVEALLDPPISERTTPLSLSTARRFPAFAEYGVPPGRSIPVYIDHAHQYVVNVWHGADASRLDMRIAERVVASIRILFSPSDR